MAARQRPPCTGQASGCLMPVQEPKDPKVKRSVKHWPPGREAPTGAGSRLHERQRGCRVHVERGADSLPWRILAASWPTGWSGVSQGCEATWGTTVTPARKPLRKWDELVTGWSGRLGQPRDHRPSDHDAAGRAAGAFRLAPKRMTRRPRCPAERATDREVGGVAAVLVAGSEKAAAHRLGLFHSTAQPCSGIDPGI